MLDMDLLKVFQHVPNGKSTRTRETIGDIVYWSFGVQKIQVEYHTLWLCQNNYGKSPFIVIFSLEKW